MQDGRGSLCKALSCDWAIVGMAGDVGVIEINGVLSAGYFTEYGFAVKADHGLVFRPMTDVARAFQIGGR